ncbi:TadE/TadG family type IV pilus assembly protein [Roseibium aestuarii]|uniref:Pilus assembly protein TadG-related protein n=1 Tax=Roseibium aestuarii TaxID=2600299 RepID=A0ABW4JZB4_9HYPH|nr:TadE/TadG family type IV pilus assembly protein [Roseibium aestuarii]
MDLAALRRLSRLTREFGHDVRGAILPILALAMIPLVVIAGAGIDYGRAISQREVLSNALDVAALNIASQLSASIMTDDEIQAALEAAFEANLTSLGYTDEALENLTFNVNPDEGVVTVASEISVPTYFIHIGDIGPKKITMTVSSEVNYSKFEVELALILDVTGSMAQDYRDIAALRDASEGLVDTLIPDGTVAADSKVKISVIPYSEGVNIGSGNASAASNGKASGGCVTERISDAQFTDDPYDWGADIEGNDPTITTYFGGGSTDCPPTNPVVPLTASRTTLISAIRALSGVNGTAGQVGIAWGWFTLSPNWASFWPAGSEPAEYTNDDILKFAIIMTDGDFNMEYNYVKTSTTCTSGHYETQYYWNGWQWRTRNVYVCDAYKDNYGWRETYTSNSSYNGNPAVRGRAICDNMKSAGIAVYSIYFETTGSAFGEDEMRYCASSSKNFYFADDADTLNSAFANIAKKIQAIYLAK